MKKVYLSVALAAMLGVVKAQVSTNNGSGLASTYPSLADAITALNAATISSPVIITLTAPQTAPAGGYQVTAQGSAVNNIVINGKGSIVTAAAGQAAGNLTDGVFKLVGADYVTIQEFVIAENSANTISDKATNNMTEWGIAVLVGTGNNGAKNITVSNNSISLNKTYANSFGIYASTAHSFSDVIAASDITNADGGNDNLSINKNIISNVNIPVAVVGSPAFPGTGLVVGSGAGNGNTLTDWGTTSELSGFARVGNPVNYSNSTSFYPAIGGIMAVNQVAPFISFNTLTSTGIGIADGCIVGVYTPVNGTIAYPGTASTTNINNNTVALSSNVDGLVSTSTTAPPLVSAIRVVAGNNVQTININNNNITGINHLHATPRGGDTLIYSAAQPMHLNMNGNQFTNLAVGNTGTLALFGIHSRVFMPVNGTQNINNNSIVGSLTRTQTSSTLSNTIMITRPTIPSPVAGDGSEEGSVFTVQGNNFSNVQTNGNAFTGVGNFDGKQSSVGSILPTLTKSIIGNTFSNINVSITTAAITTSTIVTVVNVNNRGSNVNIKDNLIENLSGTSPAFSAITGISVSGGTNINAEITGNTLRGFVGAQLFGISSSAQGMISNNVIYGFTGRTQVGVGCVGITGTGIPTGTALTVNNNKIGNIQNDLVGLAGGINFAAGATSTVTIIIFNNKIADLKAPIASGLNAVSGIVLGAGIFTANIAYNTVHLNASSSAATFGGSALSLTNTAGASYTVRNNILYNLSTPGTEVANSPANGVVAALRLSTGSLAVRPVVYNTASNNNLFFVNSNEGTGNRLLYAEGTTASILNGKNTLADLKTFLAAADANSVTENTTNNPFLSLDASSSNFLKVNPAFIFAANNAGAPIAGITTDFDGDARSASTPDIGADEYTQNGDALPLPVTILLFNGHKTGSDNVLSWITATEISNKGFDVQRSSNGTSFTTIGFVNSKAFNGNSNAKIEYSFTDRNVGSGNFYYRLVQRDLNGNNKLSSVIHISDNASAKAGIAAMYPNPVRSQLNLQVNATRNDNITLVITDINGRMLKQVTRQVAAGANNVSVDVNSIPLGIYNVTVYMNELDQKTTQRFVKQ